MFTPMVRLDLATGPARSRQRARIGRGVLANPRITLHSQARLTMIDRGARSVSP
jgi:hypothetical protein